MTLAVGADRPSARRLAIFNHKGGVGKTTLTMNIAAVLARSGRRVLVVDSDPQCNLTSYLIQEDVVDDLLDKSDADDGQTIWSALKPIADGMGNIRSLKPIETAINGLYLIPGDIQLSEFESYLDHYWAECLQRRPVGFRGTTAISDVVSSACRDLDIDYVFYDSGPNIGPLNRVILLDCDYLIVPVACDLFSLRSLRTLGRTLVDWIKSWNIISSIAAEGTPLLPGRPQFLGYIPQRFRIYAGVLTQQHQQFLDRIEREILTQVVGVLRDLDPKLVTSRKKYRLGAMRDYGALVPASQRSGEPIYAVDAGSDEQRTMAFKVLTQIGKIIDDYVRGAT